MGLFAALVTLFSSGCSIWPSGEFSEEERFAKLREEAPESMRGKKDGPSFAKTKTTAPQRISTQPPAVVSDIGAASSGKGSAAPFTQPAINSPSGTKKKKTSQSSEIPSAADVGL